MKRRKFILAIPGVLFLITLLMVGCATTHQVRNVWTSGFLGSYDQLRPGGEDQALLVYVDSDVNFDHYNQIILEPVQLIATEGSDLAKVDPVDAKAMADYFHTVLDQSLRRDYEMVTEPGPKAMRIRVALTDVAGSKVVLDTVGTIVPIGLALSAVKRAATGTHLSIGKAYAEAEILDAVTGKRLAAAVDGRAGRKVTGRLDKFSRWKDAQDACDYWAERIRLRLDQLSDAGYILHGTE